MTSDTLWSRIREKPFKPFRLNTSDGKHYDVFHPETILLFKSKIVIALYERDANPDQELSDRSVTVSPLHVASLEDLPAASARG